MKLQHRLCWLMLLALLCTSQHVQAEIDRFELLSTVGFGDELSCLGMSHRNPNVVMLGTARGKIHRTTDGGATWQEITVTPFRDLFFGRERQEDPRFEYALGLPGHSPLLQKWLREKGLHTAGVNMQQLLVKKGDKVVNINWIEIDPNDERRIYVGTIDGLYVSFDQGRTFIRTFQGQSGQAERVVNTVAVDPFDAKTIMLGTADGLHISHDRGATFRKEMNFYIRDSNIRGLYFDPKFKGLVHMAMSGSSMASPDGGKNWITTYWDEWAPRSEVTWISLGPDNVRALSTHDGIFASWQGGEYGTWKRRGQRFIGEIVTAVMITQQVNIWYALTEHAVWRSQDAGATWNKVMQLGGAEQPRWLESFESTEQGLWLLTNRRVYRMRAPEAAQSAAPLAGADRRLLDLPELSSFLQIALQYKHLYYGDTQGYRERSPWAALLPEVNLGVSYMLGRTSYLAQAYPYLILPWVRYNGLSDLRPGVEVLFSWDLGRLFHDRRELPGFGRIERNLEQLRRELSDRVLRLYAEYRQVAERLVRAQPAQALVREYDRLRLQEIAAFFDSISGGYWSQATGGVL